MRPAGLVSPTVPRLVIRIFRLLILAVIAAASYVLLEPHGHGWLVLPVAVVITLVASGYRYVRLRGSGGPTREERWQATVLDGARRPLAIREVRAAIEAVEPANREGRAERARLSVILAELLDAEGDVDGAESVLAALDLDVLDPLHAALVRHAWAVVRLRGGDAAGARQILEARLPRSGDPYLDMRLELLEATARVELGEADRALEVATSVRQRAGKDGDLALEARVVRAAALDGIGQRSDAIEVMRSLSREVLESLSELGQPRIQRLAAEALGD